MNNIYKIKHGDLVIFVNNNENWLISDKTGFVYRIYEPVLFIKSKTVKHIIKHWFLYKNQLFYDEMNICFSNEYLERFKVYTL